MFHVEHREQRPMNVLIGLRAKTTPKTPSAEQSESVPRGTSPEILQKHAFEMRDTTPHINTWPHSSPRSTWNIYLMSGSTKMYSNTQISLHVALIGRLLKEMFHVEHFRTVFYCFSYIFMVPVDFNLIKVIQHDSYYCNC